MRKTMSKMLIAVLALVLALTATSMLALAADTAAGLALADDFSTVASAPKFESKTGNWLEHENVGYYRESSDTQDLIYKIDTAAPFFGIKSVRAIINADGGLTAYNDYHIGNTVKYSVFASSDKQKWFRVGVGSGEAVPAGETYNKKHANDLVVSTVDAIESNMKYIKVSFEKVGGNNNYTLGFKKVEITKYTSQPPVVEPTALAVADSTLTSMEAGGKGIEFAGIITPANATIRAIAWSVYSDEGCLTTSALASFNENLLIADHEQTAAQTVYVQGALSNGVKTPEFAVSVTPRPAPSSVEITEFAPQINEGDSANIMSVILPANANDKSLTYRIYSDEACTAVSAKATITDGVFKAVTKGKVWLKVTTANGKSDKKEITITKNVMLFSDNCESLDYLYKTSDKSVLMIHNSDRIMRSVKTVNKEGFAAGKAYVSQDAEEKFDVYTPPQLVYKTNNDILRFETDLLINFPLIEAKKVQNKNKARDYTFETFVSGDGKEWEFIQNDYNVSPPAPSSGLDGSAYSVFNVYNAEALPAGTRYFKLVLIGPATTVVYKDGAQMTSAQKAVAQTAGAQTAGIKAGETKEIDRDASKANFYESLTTPMSEAMGGYDKIWGFFNTWEPAVTGVRLFAAEGTTAVDSLAAIIVDDSENTVTKGEEYSIKAATATLLNKTPVKITDFSDYTVSFTAGGDYLTYSSGKISLKPAFAGQIQTAKFKLIKGDVESGEITLNLVVPVESVTATLDTNRIKIGAFAKLSASANPDNASVNVITYHAKTAAGQASDYVTVQGDGKIKGKKAGAVTVWAEIDGVKSNELTLTIVPETAISITSATTATVGDVIDLTANLTPADAGTIVWSIVSGGEYATIEGAKLTATAAGTVKVKATVDGVSVEIEIVITQKAGCGCGAVGLNASNIPPIIGGAIIVLGAMLLAMLLKKKSQRA